MTISYNCYYLVLIRGYESGGRLQTARCQQDLYSIIDNYITTFLFFFQLRKRW